MRLHSCQEGHLLFHTEVSPGVSTGVIGRLCHSSESLANRSNISFTALPVNHHSCLTEAVIMKQADILVSRCCDILDGRKGLSWVESTSFHFYYNIMSC